MHTNRIAKPDMVSWPTNLGIPPLRSLYFWGCLSFVVDLKGVVDTGLLVPGRVSSNGTQKMRTRIIRWTTVS
uniref:Uncharacterized protein n=1 Tax=Physcomitrium patens TaxID=3218 RepID=A0A2K1IYL5_PHYPA|nr:hypothetical protein PHYPA_024182 [Physcomitrium patens]